MRQNMTDDNAKKKREITPHKGGKTKFLGGRVLPEIHEKATKLAKEKNMNMSEFLAFLVNKECDKG